MKHSDKYLYYKLLIETPSMCVPADYIIALAYVEGYDEAIKLLKKNDDELHEQDMVDFNNFWDLYNYKVGDKKKCRLKWNRLTSEEKRKIFVTLPAFLKLHPQNRYKPYPLTYLNNARWNDDLSALAQRNVPNNYAHPDLANNKKVYN